MKHYRGDTCELPTLKGSAWCHSNPAAACTTQPQALGPSPPSAPLSALPQPSPCAVGRRRPPLQILQCSLNVLKGLPRQPWGAGGAGVRQRQRGRAAQRLRRLLLQKAPQHGEHADAPAPGQVPCNGGPCQPHTEGQALNHTLSLHASIATPAAAIFPCPTAPSPTARTHRSLRRSSGMSMTRQV